MLSCGNLALILIAASLQGAVASLSSGCGKAVGTGSGTKSTTVNGKTRQYILQLPANYNASTGYKLIFGYHWRGGTMNDVAPGYYGLRDLARETAIFVAPQGLNNGWANSGGEDLTFTDQMIDYITSNTCVDEDQVFSTGWSYGGAMTFELACSRPNVFKAVAVIAGAQLSGCDGGTTPIPYLGIHGVVDSVLPISLGRGLRDKFLQLNGCASKNTPEPAGGSGTHVKTTYDCRPGFPVWWIAHSGDHVPDPKDAGQSQSWAPGETWSFFTQPGLKGQSGTGGGSSSSSSSVPTTSITTSSTIPTTTTVGGGCSVRYSQCGGIGWSGPTCCQIGTMCNYLNDWYSQCL
ncbi:carbohydrate-binding module family 1 protein [Trichoderma asperellum CBS 433.97]|uniref:Feruloyl esterase C n=2 Tax=Trichoderma asperellum TaxID=101201 RepID=A0A2T3YQI3_TRIA4|nr:carbohydrate-binding module family 1 protein [Trichoderma asperellum CBS 433.97]PTB34777.1 carbohydrate-binding module family 1 protein [Trichoderma asperellum CBS 433.97]